MALILPKEKPSVEQVAEQHCLADEPAMKPSERESVKSVKYYQDGVSLYRKKRFAEAQEQFTKAMAIAGSYALFCRVVIGKNSEQLLSPDDAEKFHIESIRQSPKNGKYYVAYAAFLSRSKRPKEAISQYYEAVALMPQSGKYHSELATLLAREGSRAEAIKYFLVADTLLPDNMKVTSSLGNLFTKAEKIEEAESYFRRLESTSPEGTTYLKGLIGTLVKQLKFKEALPYCLRAIEAFADDPSHLLRLADIYAGLKQPLKAADAMRDYLKEIEPAKPGQALMRRTIHQQRAGVFSETEQQTRFFSINYMKHRASNLDSVQRRIVEETLDTGIARSSIEELFDDAAFTPMIEAAEAQLIAFRNDPKSLELIERITTCRDFANDPSFRGIFKPSVVNYIVNRGPIHANNPLVQPFLSNRILNIANAYNGMLSKLRNVNGWINPPISGANIGSRKGSQIWHRDQEDEKILKCFIYFSDVDEETGALDYAKYSKCMPDGKYSDLHPYPFSSGYPGSFIFDKHIDPADIVCAKGKKGMIAFVDTNGFHRGGYVTKGERRVLMGTYLRPTSPYTATNTRLQLADADASAFSPKALYALT